MTGSRLLAGFAALALSTSACGVFKSTDSSKEAKPRGGEIGAGLPEEETTVATTAKPTTTRPAPKPTVDPNICKPGDNTSEVRYDPGIVLLFTVSTTCATRTTDVLFKLKVTNSSAREIRYNPNQFEFFSIKAPRGENKSSWKDRDCTPPPTGDRNKPARTLVPGAALDFSAKYPGPDGVADREKCRKLEGGAYDAHAVFLLCEDDAYVDGYCNMGKATQLFAQPIRINFAR